MDGHIQVPVAALVQCVLFLDQDNQANYSKY